MITPPYLVPGDSIGIISTASRINRDVVEPAITFLKDKGFKVITGKHTFSTHYQYSATDKERAEDLQQMLNNTQIKAILCSRGGYGTLRTISHINWNSFMQCPKWIIGFSDITVLHAALQLNKVASIHGVMPKFFIENNAPTTSLSTLLNALCGHKLEYTISHNPFNRYGKCEGPLVGGNLSVLYSLRGTPIDLDTAGKILFIEDVDEYKYHIDRMMLNFKIGTKLENLAGLIVGSFSGVKDHDQPYGKTIEEIILDAVEGTDYPVLFDFPAGHSKENYAIKFGLSASIDVNKTESHFLQHS